VAYLRIVDLGLVLRAAFRMNHWLVFLLAYYFLTYFYTSPLGRIGESGQLTQFDTKEENPVNKKETPRKALLDKVLFM